MNPPADHSRVTPDAGDGWPVTRRELVVVPGLVLLAFVLRAWHPARICVEHFDEGVYASNPYCSELINPQAPFSYPDRFLYAPPLMPAFLQWAMEWAIVLGGSAAGLMWVNVVAGSITVLLVWWVARDWFSPVSAVVACTLAATNEYHIAFSRTALTDPLLCLWLLLAVYAGWKAAIERGVVWIAIAGIAAGLAWCTKYNGWLALAMTGSGTAAWLLVSRPPVRSAAATLAVWTVSAVIAAAMFWIIVLDDLAPHGGYSAVAANHSRYFVGLGGWWTSFLHQVVAHRELDGWVTLAGVSCTVGLASLFSACRFTWNGAGVPRTSSLLIVSLTILLAGLMGGSSLLLGAAGLCGALLSIGMTQPTGSASDSEGPTGNRAANPNRLAGWIASAWYFGLLVAVPLYYPYPRLSLPWLVINWILASVCVSNLVKASNSWRWLDVLGRGRSAAAIGLLVLAAIVSARTRGRPIWPARGMAWQDRTALQAIARQILQDAEYTVTELPASGNPAVDAVFYVYGEPPVFFHLESLADETSLRFVSQPAGNLDLTQPGATDADVATFLVTGMHSNPESDEFVRATGDLRLIANYEYDPSLLVRLDQPNEVGGPLPPEHVRLYLIHAPY